jgi:hypothetical protein
MHEEAAESITRSSPDTQYHGTPSAFIKELGGAIQRIKAFWSCLPFGRPLIGLRWYVIPVALNALGVMQLPVFDGGVTNAANNYFAIPYWVMVAIIGIRRARRVTPVDFLFLICGNSFLTALLWRIHPLTRSAGH